MPYKDLQRRREYHNAYLTAWLARNPEKRISKWTRKTINKRNRVLNIIGRGQIKCVYCGCKRREFLEVNHMNGGGTQENARPSKFYGDIVAGRRNIEDLELRCKICNSLHYLESKYGETGFKISWTALRP